MDAVLSLKLRDFRDERIGSGKAMTAAERGKKKRLFDKIAGKKPVRTPPKRIVLPFIGIDGEGGGTDEIGRQNYLLLHAANREYSRQLFNNNTPLTTTDCLDFICRLPAKAILVGFAFNYDVTQILKDLPDDKRKRLFWSDAEREVAGVKSPYTYYRDFAIAYRPSQYFRVARVKNQKIVPNSSRTVYETWGFFQSSFVNALKDFQIGNEDLDFIEEKKKEREGFTMIDDSIKQYCHTECVWMADLMEVFRTLCHDGGIIPRTWNGAGKLAKALHAARKTPRRKDLDAVPADLWEMAQKSYYGGRFEIFRTGRIRGPVYEYDICSAYPDAMLSLPCLLHGKWIRGTFDENSPYSIAKVQFEHRLKGNDRRSLNVCGLPIRTKKGVITWPNQGIGIYWNCELQAAKKLGAKFKVIDKKNSWSYQKRCDCQPFSWVEELYNYRLSIGKSVKGKPIKLGINALYGALAQRVGNGPWKNYIWASLITALTRAKLIEAASHAPDDILMIATDGIYSTSKLPLEIGERLGQWEVKECPTFFIVQPGFYWGAKKPKRRGMPKKFFDPFIGRFEQVWDAWIAQGDLQATMPYIDVPLTRFVGLRQATAWNRPELAGRWQSTEDDGSPLTRRLSYEWTNKRRLADGWIDGGCVRHYPILTAPLETVYYDWTAETETVSGQWALETEASPDYIDYTAPGTGE